MKRIISLLCCFTLCMCLVPKAEALADSAKAAVLINAETGEVLYGKNENEVYPMASTTKIMTALLSIESGNLDEKFTVDSTAIKVEGTSMGLKEGDKVTLYELCIGMLLSSGNDAANAAAVRVAGSKDAFTELMNKKAESLGLKNTNFLTPSGLDADGHGSTAYDMALLGAAALENEVFKSICSQKSAKVCFGQPEITRTLYNHNKLLTLDEDIIGIKTGYTKKAGRCLVSAKEIDGVTLVAVTLHASSDWDTHLSLFDHGFSLIKTKNAQSGEYTLPLVGGEKDSVLLKSEEGELSYIGEVTEKVVLPQFLYAPVEAGAVIGEIKYYTGINEVASFPIYAAESVGAAEKATLWEKIRRFFESIFR